MSNFQERKIPLLFYRVDNLRCIAGHIRILGDRPGRGLMIYGYHEQAPGWALHRRWNLGFFCIHHIGPGKATDPSGWSVRFASLKFSRIRGGFSIQWFWADTWSTRRNSDFST